MRKYIVILVALCLSSVAIADNQGIKNRNYSLATSISDSDSGNRLSIFGSVRLPIANYIGATFTGRLSEFDGQNNYIDSSSNSVTLGVFLRKLELGIIYASYSYSKTEMNSSVSDSKNNIKTTHVSGTYYINEFDVGLGRSKADPDSGNSSNTSNAIISYYIDENLRVGGSVHKMDADATNVFISYQPQLFGNTTSLSASYHDAESDDTFTVSLAYYFDTKVNFKDRIRRY